MSRAIYSYRGTRGEVVKSWLTARKALLTLRQISIARIRFICRCVANAQKRMSPVFAGDRATKKPGMTPGFPEIVTLLKRLVYSKPAFLSVPE